MPARGNPTVRERRLAEELRLLREARELPGQTVAEKLDWSPSKVSRIEHALVGIGVEDLERLLTLYGVPDRRASYLRRLAPLVRQKGWWDAYAGSLNPEYTNLLKLEAGSNALWSYCAMVPHAMLLTADYARRIIELAPQRPSEIEIGRRLDIVERRQQVLRPHDGLAPMTLSVVIDESVLHRRVVTGPDTAGDLAVTVQQLRRIVELAGEPHVTIRVLPFTVGLPPVSAGSFSILGSPASEDADVVYLENKSRIFFLESESEVGSYVQDFELLSAWALSPADSVDFINERLATLSR
jgi:transcriptional regulator with XRE-family HTH domain